MPQPLNTRLLQAQAETISFTDDDVVDDSYSLAGLVFVFIVRQQVACFFFFKEPPPPEISPLSLHDALPILPTPCIWWKATNPGASLRAPGRPGVVRDPGMRRRSLRGNREISRSTVRQPPPVRIGKARSRKIGRAHV